MKTLQIRMFSGKRATKVEDVKVLNAEPGNAVAATALASLVQALKEEGYHSTRHWEGRLFLFLFMFLFK